jgi:hypothetical protein
MCEHLIQIVEKEIGTTITSDIWAVDLESILEKNTKYIKINAKFHIGDYFFYKELKFVSEHFNEFIQINNEFIRQLKMLNDYTNFISNLLEKDYEIITDDWCLRLSEYNYVSPIETYLTILFFKKTDLNTMFDKVLCLTVDSYVSKEYFDNVNTTNLIILNQPIDINYYKNLIN